MPLSALALVLLAAVPHASWNIAAKHAAAVLLLDQTSTLAGGWSLAWG